MDGLLKDRKVQLEENGNKIKNIDLEKLKMDNEIFEHSNSYKIIDDFLSSAIGVSKNSAMYYWGWLKDDNVNQTSGDEYFVEKKGNLIIIGNLWDENILTDISKGILEKILMNFSVSGYSKNWYLNLK